MVATGSYTNQAQVVDLESNNECSALANYPLYLNNAVGSVMDGSPLICSGSSESSGSYEDPAPEDQSVCYKYEKQSQQWEMHASLKTGRRGAASAKIGNDLWVTGGTNSDYLASTEYVKPDGSVIDGPDLPEVIHAHCMVTLHDGSVAILGGASSRLEDYLTPDYLTQTIQLELY